MFKRFRKNEKGQGMVEYGLILALVSIISITALGGIGGNIKDKFNKVVSGIGGSVVEDDNIVEKTEPTYTEEIQDLIDQGYIPIATTDELNQLRHNTKQAFGGGEYTSGLDKKYIQVANIDLGGINNFEPIGTTNTTNSFTGTYDGGGYTISNLKIDKGSNGYAGLFGRIDGSAELKNIGLVNADVSGGTYVGGLVGVQHGDSTITNSYATGKVNGTGRYVGGLVGEQRRGSITNSYASASVSGGHRVGGLVGEQSSGSITNSYASGSVSGTGNDVGGLVGQQYYGSITNSYATGSVSGTGSDVGGLVGLQDSGSITSSYWDKDATGRTTSSGTGATGKTTVEMKTKETFSGWDFVTIWQIKSGEYPTLQ